MIWYLLYPLRGTTEVPVLSATHPLRRAFARYGRYVARHVVTTLLISVAVAAILCYPFPFLYTTDFTNGASNLPHHVWTDAQPLGDRSTAEPDVIMRSIWVHGSYMKALEHDVLLGALELQDQLLGPTQNFNPRRPAGEPYPDGNRGDLSPELRDSFHVVNGLTSSSWFFHSPLLYWSCSPDNILADSDIIWTVNEKKTQPTSAKVTLRHSIVFSGKRFQDRRLTAADALVITLIHLGDSPVGEQWVRKAEELAGRVADKWIVLPEDGKSMPSQLYEFQFRPISLQDTALLTLAYTLTLFYFVLSLSKLRAVKSKFGLILTILTQIVVSMISSFTLCAIFKLDLSRIPYFAYPLVVLAISMENSFRLINAVLMTPSDHSISTRIGYAFGETAHVAVASRAQNLAILWGLSKITFPGVAAFCTFAAIAIIFDFFYLSTFFLSVLSIDVHRIELSDALEKVSAKSNRQSSVAQPRQSWIDAMLQGKIALSTRITGTIVMLGFVLIAQWHFSDNDHVLQTLSRLFNVPWKKSNSNRPGSSLPIDIHQARSPTSWLRLQDHETAREVIKVVKPHAHSYIARVYDPLVFVLKGSDRMPHTRERLLLPAVYDFMNHQFLPFIVTVLIIVAAVRLLMNYLLWDESAQRNGDDDLEGGPLLSIRSLGHGHALDIAMMASASVGQLVTVGLDRLICVWDLRSGLMSYVLSSAEDLTRNPFPVLAMAIDHDSRRLALLSSYQLLLWDMATRKWGPSIPLDLIDQKPEAFFFASHKSAGSHPVLVVKRNGTMVELRPDLGECLEHVVCKSPLLSVLPITEKSATQGQANRRLSIVTASRNSCIHMVTRRETGWASEGVKFALREEKDVQSLVALPEYSAYMVARSQTIDLIDLHSAEILHTFHTERMQPRSVKCLHSARRSRQGGAVGLGSLTIAFVSAETGNCVLQTYLPKEEGDTICLCSPSRPASSTCCAWTDTRKFTCVVPNPGAWETLPAGCIVGVRKKAPENDVTDGNISSLQRLRRRRNRVKIESKPASIWEAWAKCQFDKQGACETQPLETGDEESSHLMISELGPMVKVGTASVAVALGNVVKILTVGHERFDTSEDPSAESLINLSNRRRRMTGASRNRATP